MQQLLLVVIFKKILTELRKKIILSQKTIIKLFTDLSEESVLLEGCRNQEEVITLYAGCSMTFLCLVE